VSFASAPVTSADRKMLAKSLWTNVAAGFTPVRQSAGAPPRV